MTTRTTNPTQRRPRALKYIPNTPWVAKSKPPRRGNVPFVNTLMATGYFHPAEVAALNSTEDVGHCFVSFEAPWDECAAEAETMYAAIVATHGEPGAALPATPDRLYVAYWRDPSGWILEMGDARYLNFQKGHGPDTFGLLLRRPQLN
jgi:hypothetical protein